MAGIGRDSANDAARFSACYSPRNSPVKAISSLYREMISVFIRTYHGDLAWLKYCLASVHRNLRGWAEIVVCIPEGQEALLEGIITTERVVTLPALS